LIRAFLSEIFPPDYIGEKISDENIGEIVQEIYRNNIR
jgi:hypothetical protein